MYVRGCDVFQIVRDNQKTTMRFKVQKDVMDGVWCIVAVVIVVCKWVDYCLVL